MAQLQVTRRTSASLPRPAARPPCLHYHLIGPASCLLYLLADRGGGLDCPGESVEIITFSNKK